MHLERGLTTTSTKKRKTKVTKAQQEELERGWRERNVRLKQMHLPKETFEQYLEWVYGTGKKTKRQEAYEPKASKATTTTYPGRKQEVSKEGTAPGRLTGTEVSQPARIWVTGPCASKPSPIYTGTKVVGISQMAKSNAVPVFSSDEILDIARMRR
jgi:hypothetical protein